MTNLAKSFSAEITVNQITIPGLTEEEIAVYLQHRVVVAGYAGERLFNASAGKNSSNDGRVSGPHE